MLEVGHAGALGSQQQNEGALVSRRLSRESVGTGQHDRPGLVLPSLLPPDASPLAHRTSQPSARGLGSASLHPSTPRSPSEPGQEVGSGGGNPPVLSPGERPESWRDILFQV